MASLYVAEEGVIKSVQSLIAQYHPHLASCDKEILVLFKEKASKAGSVYILGKTKKASEELALVGDQEYRFVLVLAADKWLELGDKHRIALLDHLLCGCRIEEKEDGTLRHYIAAPDVSFYHDEVSRHGPWMSTDEVRAIIQVPVEDESTEDESADDGDKKGKKGKKGKWGKMSKKGAYIDLD